MPTTAKARARAAGARIFCTGLSCGSKPSVPLPRSGASVSSSCTTAGSEGVMQFTPVRSGDVRHLLVAALLPAPGFLRGDRKQARKHSPPPMARYFVQPNRIAALWPAAFRTPLERLPSAALSAQWTCARACLTLRSRKLRASRRAADLRRFPRRGGPEPGGFEDPRSASTLAPIGRHRRSPGTSTRN
jgi:hypothetical protein